MPLTKSKPKCMVELNHKPLLKHQIDVLINNGIKDITIGGYLHETIDFKEITLHQTPEFAQSIWFTHYFVQGNYLKKMTMIF